MLTLINRQIHNDLENKKKIKIWHKIIISIISKWYDESNKLKNHWEKLWKMKCVKIYKQIQKIQKNKKGRNKL